MCSLHLRIYLQRNLWARKHNKKAFHKSRFFCTALNLHLLLSRGGFLLYVGMILHGHTHTRCLIAWRVSVSKQGHSIRATNLNTWQNERKYYDAVIKATQRFLLSQSVISCGPNTATPLQNEAICKYLWKLKLCQTKNISPNLINNVDFHFKFTVFSIFVPLFQYNTEN